MEKSLQSGFSLVELVVAMAVAAILVTLAVPNFNKYLVTSRLSQTANAALSAFNAGRVKAIANNTYVGVDPASCNGNSNFAYGGFTWLQAQGGANPDTAVPPTTAADTRIITGSPIADGSTCASGNKITAPTISPTASLVFRYNASGRIESATARAAGGWSNSMSAASSGGLASMKFCDLQTAVPTGFGLNIATSGRVAVQAGVACP